jgi:hypothetical protein
VFDPSRKLGSGFTNSPGLQGTPDNIAGKYKRDSSPRQNPSVLKFSRRTKDLSDIVTGYLLQLKPISPGKINLNNSLFRQGGDEPVPL